MLTTDRDFNQIQGNSLIVKSLQSSLVNGKVSHAYIFDGQKSMGKRLLAETFAKALLCESGDTRPCGRCISCKTFEANSNPDVIYVKPVKTISLGMEDMREQLISTVNIMPYKYRRKVYIVDNAEKMTAGAQNSLLKTIEQPPDYAVFLLISNNLSLLLPTVLSRCVLYRLKPLNHEEIYDFLIKKGADTQHAHICASYCNGSIGEAIELLYDPKFNDFREEILNIITNLKIGSVTDVYNNVKKMEKFKDNIGQALDIFSLWYRDALVYKSTAREGFIAEKDKVDELKGFCQCRPLENLIRGLDSITDACGALGKSTSFQLVMEVMFMKLADI